jgi:exopolysaccharide production protein ExoZ
MLLVASPSRSLSMPNSDKLHSIHFLRFAAAVAVVVHHTLSGCGSHLTIFASGVEVFFVISGVVIGLALAAAPSPGSFALKRLIRVIPFYWLATLLFGVARLLIDAPVCNRGELLRSLLLWPAFGTDWSPFYYPAWSLEYEMFFYLVASLALLAFRQQARFACLTAMAFVAVVHIPVPFSPSQARFDTVMDLEFCAGMLIAIAVGRRTLLSRRHAGAASAFALLALASNDGTFDTLGRTLSWGVSAAVLVFALLSFDDRPWFRSRFVQMGGDASYALYLTHLTVIETLQWAFRRHGWPWMSHAASALAISVPLSIGVAFAVHAYLERPLLEALRRWLPTRAVAKETVGMTG